MIDEQPVGDERLVETGGQKGLPIRGTRGLDLAVDDPVPPEDEASRVAERRRLDDGALRSGNRSPRCSPTG